MDKGNVKEVVESYEQLIRDTDGLFWDKIGFLNAGYWKSADDSIEHAQINLIETLVSFFTKSSGNVLDVACGKGASTKFLTKHFRPENIFGINISEKQLEICRVIAPECNFKQMDATSLDFPDLSFDNILCIEAAPHFRTRQRFFEEAYRVLRPGGRLAMSDVVLHDEQILNLWGAKVPKEAWPKENYLPDLHAYRETLSTVGFRHVRVEDSTDVSLLPFRAHRIQMLERELDTNEANYQRLTEAREVQRWDSFWTWCMVYAVK